MITKRFIQIVCICLLLSACSIHIEDHSFWTSVRSEKQYPPIGFFPKVLQITAIGDSLTVGVGDSKENGGYLSLLQSFLEEHKFVKEASITNLGVIGYQEEQLISQLQDNDVQNSIKKSDMIIITIGGNDVFHVFKENYRELKLEHFEKAEEIHRRNLESILKSITSLNPKAIILLIGIYNPFSKFINIMEIDEIVDSWNTASEEVISSYQQAYFISIADIFSDTEDHLIYEDYFHPNNKGYELIAERVYAYIEKQNLLVNLFE